jgi:hypothetical protein
VNRKNGDESFCPWKLMWMARIAPYRQLSQKDVQVSNMAIRENREECTEGLS